MEPDLTWNEGIASGEHFWAAIDDQLVCMMRNREGGFYTCGPEKKMFKSKDFVYISGIDFPAGHRRLELKHL